MFNRTNFVLFASTLEYIDLLSNLNIRIIFVHWYNIFQFLNK